MTASPTATTQPRFEDEPCPPLSSVIGWRGLVQIAVIGALAIAAFWTPLRETVIQRWIDDGNWSHGWLVPLFSLYFLHTRREELARADVRPSFLGLPIIIAFLGAYYWTVLFLPISYARPVCFVGVLFGATLFLGGWHIVRVAWFPLAFLLLAVPLPDSLYVDLTMPLRKISSVVAAQILSAIPNLQTDISGVVIDYVYKNTHGSLNVEQACSGMRLMMSFVTLGVAMAYLGDRPTWQRIIMVLSCIPIAIICNIIRVTTTGILYVFKDQPIGQRLDLESWTRGTPHALIGLAMLPIALGLFALVGWILNNFFVEDDSDPIRSASAS